MGSQATVPSNSQAPRNSQETNGLKKGASFADVLERLDADANGSASGGSHAEGGSDAWARPKLPRIDPAKDTIGMLVLCALFESLSRWEVAESEWRLRRQCFSRLTSRSRRIIMGVG